MSTFNITDSAVQYLKGKLRFRLTWDPVIFLVGESLQEVDEEDDELVQALRSEPSLRKKIKIIRERKNQIIMVDVDEKVISRKDQIKIQCTKLVPRIIARRKIPNNLIKYIITVNGCTISPYPKMDLSSYSSIHWVLDRGKSGLVLTADDIVVAGTKEKR